MENHIVSVMNLLSEASSSLASSPSSAPDHKARNLFQWGGTFSAILLLVINRLTRKSRTQTTLLVAFLLSSLPTVLLNILRGELGYWIAFFAVGAHLFFPEEFSVSRFILFVISPSWVIHELHDSIVGVILCILIGVILFIDNIKGSVGFDDRRCDLCCFFYWPVIIFMFYCTILYLGKGPW